MRTSTTVWMMLMILLCHMIMVFKPLNFGIQIFWTCRNTYINQQIIMKAVTLAYALCKLF